MSDTLIERRCIKCEQVKPLSHFQKRSDRVNKWFSTCNTCLWQRRWELISQNPERKRDYYRSKTWQRHNVSKEEYAELLAKQKGVCAICGKPEKMLDSGTNQTRSLAIDHDHETGEVRGLLCMRCNTNLGILENEQFVSQAQAYLTRCAALRN